VHPPQINFVLKNLNQIKESFKKIAVDIILDGKTNIDLSLVAQRQVLNSLILTLVDALRHIMFFS